MALLTLELLNFSWIMARINFWLKNDGEKWSRISYIEIERAPSEILANMPGQFSLSGQIIFLHWAAATLKGLVEFQNKKI